MTTKTYTIKQHKKEPTWMGFSSSLSYLFEATPPWKRVGLGIHCTDITMI